MFKATQIVHWVTGPVYCCDRHATALKGLSAFLGGHTVSSHYDGEEQCSNCLNESKTNNPKETRIMSNETRIELGAGWHWFRPHVNAEWELWGPVGIGKTAYAYPHQTAAVNAFAAAMQAPLAEVQRLRKLIEDAVGIAKVGSSRLEIAAFLEDGLEDIGEALARANGEV